MSDTYNKIRKVAEFDNYTIPPYNVTISKPEREHLKKKAKKRLADIINQIIEDNNN